MSSPKDLTLGKPCFPVSINLSDIFLIVCYREPFLLMYLNKMALLLLGGTFSILSRVFSSMMW